MQATILCLVVRTVAPLHITDLPSTRRHGQAHLACIHTRGHEVCNIRGMRVITMAAVVVAGRVVINGDQGNDSKPYVRDRQVVPERFLAYSYTPNGRVGGHVTHQYDVINKLLLQPWCLKSSI